MDLETYASFIDNKKELDARANELFNHAKWVDPERFTTQKHLHEIKYTSESVSLVYSILGNPPGLSGPGGDGLGVWKLPLELLFADNWKELYNAHAESGKAKIVHGDFFSV